MLGKILNNRYKIIKELGKGGMAIVFEAQDLFLDRKVVLKMLRPEYVNDKDFVKKFRHEAKAVAKLSHPNIVNIFDIGQDDKCHYLVMEYVEGCNLKEIINKRGKLTIIESLDIANQICAALIVAHANNIIHCDIKPHNILVNLEKQVKVTDFGIARAINSSTMTMTMTDTIVGSAHYFSPEQAKGGEISTYSDIYSLGIVIYEMLTGQVPFKGDSPISLALKHIQEMPKRPSILNPKIPSEVEGIIMKAISKKPEARFNNATEMRENITSVLKGYCQKNNDNSTIVISDEGDTKILKKVKLNHTEIENLAQRGSVLNNNEDYLNMPVQNKKSMNWLKGLIILIGIFSIIIIGFVFFYQDYMKVPVVKVPDLVEMDFEEGQKKAAQVGLHLEKQNEGVHHPEIPKNNIISQYPTGGEMVRQTRAIMVTVSIGPAILTVPDLKNISIREAVIILENQNLVIGNKKYVYHNKIPKDYIIDQEPSPDEAISTEKEINLIISKGPQPQMVKMPNLIGLDRNEAINKIKDSHLRVGEIKEELTKRFKFDQVAHQQYSVGEELAEDTSIDLIISKGLINLENSKIHSVKVDVKSVVLLWERNQIEIVVTDNNGRDVIHNAVHPKGDRIVQIVNSVGSTTYEIFNNGELIQRYYIGD